MTHIRYSAVFAIDTWPRMARGWATTTSTPPVWRETSTSSSTARRLEYLQINWLSDALSLKDPLVLLNCVLESHASCTSETSGLTSGSTFASSNYSCSLQLHDPSPLSASPSCLSSPERKIVDWESWKTGNMWGGRGIVVRKNTANRDAHWSE